MPLPPSPALPTTSPPSSPSSSISVVSNFLFMTRKSSMLKESADKVRERRSLEFFFKSDLVTTSGSA